MSTFSGFSEAARLFAEYESVVTAMRKRFDSDVQMFLDALQDEIRARVKPSTLQVSITTPPTRFRYWWLSDHGQDRDFHALVYIDPRVADLVVPGRLTLVGAAPNSSAAQRESVLEAVSSKEHVPFVTSKSKSAWNLCNFAVKYSSPSELESIAQPIAALLLDFERIGCMKPTP